MFNTNFLLKLVKSGNTTRYVTKLLFISLLFVADFFTLFTLGNQIGLYLYLGLLGLLILIGALTSIKLIKKEIGNLKLNNSKGIYPENQFLSVIGLYFAVVLIIVPGIISTLFGYMLLLPKIRIFIGRKLTKALKLDWNAVYEYQEIYNS